MKITRLQTFLTQPTKSDDGWMEIKPFLFVSLETDAGLTGWGEAFTLEHRERGIEEIILSLGKQLLDYGEINPRSFRNDIAKAVEANHPGLDYSCAVSAIELALWDLQGKTLNAPVYELLDGALSKNVPLYANTWTGFDIDIADLAERCQSLINQGYRALKIYPLKFGGAREVGQCMKTIRETVGEDIDILLDLSAMNNPALARDCAREVTPYRPYWFEEPHSGEDLETLAEIRRYSGLRIVTGEKQSGKGHFINVLKYRAADILNPDIAGCGGILEMLEIGAMADAHSVTISPHCWNSMTVALAAMLQVCAVMPNAEMAEIFPSYLEFGLQFCQSDFALKDGVAKLGTAPGLGIDIDTEALRQISFTHNIE